MDIKFIDNKGQLSGGMGGLIGIATTLVVAAVVIAIGAKITDDVALQINGTDSSSGVGQAGYDSASNGTLAMSNLSKYLPTLATVGAAAIIIAFLLGAFAFRSR